MEKFFSHEMGAGFQTFGPLHLIILFLTFGSATLIYIFRDKLEKHIPKNITKVFAIILLVNQLIFYTGFIYYGNYDLTTDLPIHYCYVTGYLYIYMLFFNKREMFNWLFYSVFMCTFLSMIWMITDNGYDRYQMYHFITSHNGLFVINIYCFYVLKFHVDKKGMLIAFIYSNLLFICALIYNQIFSTNYIMSKNLPPLMYEMYPWLKVVNYSIFWLELAGIITLFLAYQLVRFKKPK